MITILTHDPRWRGLRPTALRAAEAVFNVTTRSMVLPPSGGRLGGGGMDKIAPHEPPPRPSSPGGGGSVALTIVLSNDAEVCELNRNYRQKNKPTNVLSFENGAEEGGITQLGDIILAYETIAREAAEQSKTLKHHLTHLVIHGVLHLLGHDHIEEAEAVRMEAIEIAILSRMGIANPYESA